MPALPRDPKWDCVKFVARQIFVPFYFFLPEQYMLCFFVQKKPLQQDSYFLMNNLSNMFVEEPRHRSLDISFQPFATQTLIIPPLTRGHCTALHCTALHFDSLHCPIMHLTALHCTAPHSLRFTALHCTALHCTALY